MTGASSGVGHELCEQLLRKGYNVVAVARHKPEFHHANALCLSVDVTDANAVQHAVETALRHFGKIDVLSNNAGTSSYMSIEEESEEEMRSVMEINFWGSYHTMRALIPHFRQNQNGTIINNSSECGLIGRAFGAAYCSSKFAIEGLTSSARHELSRFCRVMSVNLSFFPGTRIGEGKKRKTQFQAYRGLSWLPVQVPPSTSTNHVRLAVAWIIAECEKKKIRRHLMLGADIEHKVHYVIRELTKDWHYSRLRARACGLPLAGTGGSKAGIYLRYAVYKVLSQLSWGVRKQHYTELKRYFKRLI